jgi:hypothetical protein
MHHNHFLCSNAEGKVHTTTSPKDECDRWAIERDPNGYEGVIIRSVVHDRVLCFNETSLFTDVEYEGEFGVWHLEAAHSQKYSLAAAFDTKSIGPFPYVTGNKRQCDDWQIERRGDTLTFLSSKQEMFLGSTADGEVHLTVDPSESELWEVETTPNGGYVFVSQKYNRILSWSDSGEKDGKLCTVKQAASDSSNYSDREIWRLDPCLPRAVSGGKIKTFAIGTAAAVATTVALPFAVAGVVGVLGAEVGLLGELIVAGLTGAEAIADIGVVGTTAALVFKESGDTFSTHSDHSEKEKSTSAWTKRPFCAWRSW